MRSAPTSDEPDMERVCSMIDELLALEDPAPCVAWMQAAWRSYLDALGDRPLEEFLLGSPVKRGSGRTLARRYSRTKLAAALVAAARTIRADSDVSDTRLCDILAAEICGFEKQILPGWVELGGPGGGSSELRLALWQAFEVAGGPPRTARGLYGFLKVHGYLKGDGDLAADGAGPVA